MHATRHRQSENGVANYGHSRTGKLNSVYFGPQTAKNMTGGLTHPTGGYQAAGNCHASGVTVMSVMALMVDVSTAGASFRYVVLSFSAILSLGLKIV